MPSIRLPFDSDGLAIAVTQGPGDGSHGNVSQLFTAWDFALSLGSNVLAVADGVIEDIRSTVPDGIVGTVLPNTDGDDDSSNDDPSLGSGGIGNIVTIRHEIDGQTFYSSYFHLEEGSIPFTSEQVLAGTATVTAGQVIGQTGLTGSREGVTGAHLHFQVGETADFFGATNYGGWPEGSDNARPQFIAIAGPENQGLISFDGYGVTLPPTVIGPNVTVYDGTFNIVIDYSLDTAGFFDDPARRTVMDEAAQTWMDLIGDEFQDVPSGVTFSISDPSNFGARVQITLGQSIDDIRIYAGADDLGGFRPSDEGGFVITGGEGGPDGYDAAGDILRARIYPEFRGAQTTDFEPFVGTVTFNSNVDAIYSTDLSGPEDGKIDLLSTALHEIGHVLGFGVSAPFERLVSNSAFNGTNSIAANGGQPIPLESDGAHVADGFAGNTVLMDPLNFVGLRRLPSEFDLAILADIGYEITGFEKQGAVPGIVTTGNDNPVFGTIVDDRINGLSGDDQLQGDLGNDTLIGGEGNDIIFGQGGDDILVGGRDDDTLYGGDGTDIFRFEGPVGQNFIADFDYATELLEVSTSYGFSTIEEVLAAQSRPFTNATVLEFSPGQNVTIIDNSTGSTLTAANIRLISADGPIPEELEYHARVTAYGEGDMFASGVPITLPQVLPGSLANGYRINKVFEGIPGEATFYALGLIAPNGTPVLAVRGTVSDLLRPLETLLDWWQNADPNGIGYSEVVAAWPELHTWLSDNPGAYIVGHSQGGAQAQIIASFAAAGAQGLTAITDVAGVVTFNAPGIDADDVASFEVSESAASVDVIHYISSGDVVSQAGEGFLPGDVVYYDLDHIEEPSPPWAYFGVVGSAHTGQWSQPSIFDFISSDDQILGADPNSLLPLAGVDNTTELSSSRFSHLYSGGKFDDEYFGLLSAISGVVTVASNVIGSAAGFPFLGTVAGPAVAFQLSTRGGTEALRQGVGEFRDGPLNTVTAVIELGNLLIAIADKTKEAAVQSIATLTGISATLAGEFYDALVDLGSVIDAAVQAVSTWTQQNLELFADWAEATWDGISTWTADVWNAFANTSLAAIDAISNWTSEAWSEVKQFSEQALIGVADYSVAAWQALAQGSVQLLRNVGEFTEEMAQLGEEAWNAMAGWSQQQWAAVSDWTSETWKDAKDFSVAVWETSVTASAGFFRNLREDAISRINVAVETYVETRQQIEMTRDQVVEGLQNFWETQSGFSFFRDSQDIQVVSASAGTAVANSTAILIGTEADIEALNGSLFADLFFPTSDDVVILDQPQLRIDAIASSEILARLMGAENGADTIIGSVADLSGVQVSGFDANDAVFVPDVSFLPEQITIRTGSAIFSFDVDGDGTTDGELTLEGDYSGESFEVFSLDGDTVIRLAGSDASQLSKAGERFITSDTGANRVYGDDGDDVAVTGAGDDLISAGAGSDVVVAGDGEDVILGGLGADNLTGGAGADIFAFSAADFGSGFTADFITDFRPGEDVIELSGFGFTDLAGLDIVTVAEGDAINLGAGRFIVLEGLTAADLMDGDIVGAEFARTYGLISTTAVHRLTDADDRFISTDTGATEIFGRAGADAIVGGTGNDTIFGEAGADVLIGGGGDDDLIGGSGADQMTGLSGADNFVFTSGEETGFVAEFITDYELGIDRLTLEGFGITSADDFSFTTSGTGDVALQLASTRFVVFEGYTEQSVIETEVGSWVL